MKKFIFILIAVIGFGISANAQTVVVQNNEVTKSRKIVNCDFKINGICSNEDIGGVGADGLTLTNYNNSTVTIVYEVTTSRGRSGGEYFGTATQTGSMVLKANETKNIIAQGSFNINLKMIVRKLKN